MSKHAAIALALLFTPALSACGGETLLAVNASATTRTAPDLAIVTLGVVARGDTARAAQQAQTARMATVVEAARAAGVEQADIQTVGFSIEPQYTYPRGGPPRITGYASRNIVTLRVSDLSAVSGLIDSTVAEGANELQGIQFTFDDLEASREAARAEALQTARQRAETYAEAAGLRVVGMRSITEPGSTLMPWDQRRDGFSPPPVAVSLEQAAAGNAINPGQLDNAASVTVVFELR
jgi:uncharacterized protein YggE